MSAGDEIPPAASAIEPESRHPRGLYTLFFTEMWERFSYYGMRALLVLFMAKAVEEGGMGLSETVAGAIYGLYTASVYLLALPGGWIADRLLGGRRAVWYGGIIIAAGHFTIAIPLAETFFIGLVLVAIGTGLLKPNISAMVGQLYPEGSARRDAGFTIFYMGINLGAAIGPWVCSTLGEKVDWHLGFGAAGIGMVAGLIQYRLTEKSLGDAGWLERRPEEAAPDGRRIDWRWYPVAAGVGILAIVVLLGILRVITFDPVKLAAGTGTVIVGLAVVYFFTVFIFGGLSAAEAKRVLVIVVLFIASALFWAGFEQAGSSLNLFAERHTLREFSAFEDWEMPAGWFQSVNPIFILTLSPIFAALWVGLARRGREPSTPAKFAFGLVFLGLGFLVMAGAALGISSGGKAFPTWLIVTYLLHTIGELCLSPVGLSSVTKLAPRRFVGQMMGVWFLATSLGNLIAGLAAGWVSAEAAGEMPGNFLTLFIIASVSGMLLLALSHPIKYLMGGVR